MKYLTYVASYKLANSLKAHINSRVYINVYSYKSLAINDDGLVG